MTAAAIVSPAFAKEVRALLPVWALAMVGLGGSFVLGENVPLGLIAYGIGVLALGAHSVGHEYTYRTLPLLLAQPVDRRRLLLIKAAVLVAGLLTVVALPASCSRLPTVLRMRAPTAWSRSACPSSAHCSSPRG